MASGYQHCSNLLLFRCLGVGGIEAEAVMLGQSVSMVLPQVVGYRLTGQFAKLTTSTDVVLTITKVIFLCVVLYETYLLAYTYLTALCPVLPR